MEKKFAINKRALCAIAAAIVVAAGAALAVALRNDADVAARSVSRTVSRRLAALDREVEKEFTEAAEGHNELELLPSDMVVYRYEMDTLKCWHNSFPILNDDIRTRLAGGRLYSNATGAISPLADIGEDYQFSCIGSKWYIVKSVTDGFATRVIAGLEICTDDSSDGMKVVSPAIHLPAGMSISPVPGNMGSPVVYDGRSMFFINTIPDRIFSRLKSSEIFSPMLYADGPIWSSYGMLMIINILLIIGIHLFYRTRNFFPRKIGKRKVLLGAYGIFLILVSAALITHIVLSFRSLILNSNLPLHLFQFRKGTILTIFSIAVYTHLVASTIFVTQMLDPVIYTFFGKSYRPFRIRTLVPLSLVIAAFFFTMTTIITGVKESRKVELWASEMAMDRDIQLELRLRGIEDAISTDRVLNLLCGASGGEDIIRNRIVGEYLMKASQNYDISVFVRPVSDKSYGQLFAELIYSGEPVADESHFIYNNRENGHSFYSGAFTYYTKKGVTGLLMKIEPKSNRENRDFDSVFSTYSTSGASKLPENYSYAKYSGGKLISYSGIFAYPTVLEDEIPSDGYTHFRYDIDQDEAIVISRPTIGALQMTSSYLLMAVIVTICLLPFSSKKRKSRKQRNTTLSRRIGTGVLLIVILSLSCLTAVSVSFVFERNRTAQERILSRRITSIQTMLESVCADAKDYRSIMNLEFKSSLDEIARNSKAELTLFTPDGRALLTTIPDVFDKMMVGTRMNDRAFYKITHDHKRLCVEKETFGSRKFLGLYAPVFNRNDDMVAIVGSPYYSPSNIMREAIPHTILMLVIMLALIVLSQIIVSKYSETVFGPLLKLSGTMDSSDINNLHHIEYDGDDEISALVTSYNGMVDTVLASSRELVRAERSKAWSEMARQIAHDIKNPLTPIKMEIQRLVRLKQKNDQSWSLKFDNMAEVVLEQLDMLAKTASDFSTYAKLYTEEPVEIDLDKTIKDQLLIFNRDDINISYVGLENAYIMGPRPQIISVIVNLVTNAIQALENSRKGFEDEANASDSREDAIIIFLRNSTLEGYYDIVVEDNGPGVKDENLEKLFQPNFTTKTGGTGLGLAMVSSIVEMCDGKIAYSRSFTLGGACFTVTLPKLSK